MPTVTIDGRRVEVREGAYVLEAARKAGVRIPALCHHDSVEPSGACRLCMVDVTRPGWDGWRKMVAACLYPAEDGLEVFTDTERVRETRSVILDLMLARSPDTPLVRELAAEYGVRETSFQRYEEPTGCILCGLCVRVCDRVGASAISAVDRGIGREIAPPFGEDGPPDCIGCLACAEVCPTDFIEFESNGDRRKIWGKEFEMVRCKSCGKAIVTREQVAFEVKKGLVRESYFDLCDACKRRRTADTALSLGRT